MIVEQSLLEGPNGELIFNIVEDVSVYAEGAKIARERNGFSEDRSRRMNVSVPPRLYYFWANRLGEECWLDPAFLRSFIKEHPEFAACNGAI